MNETIKINVIANYVKFTSGENENGKNSCIVSFGDFCLADVVNACNYGKAYKLNYKGEKMKKLLTTTLFMAGVSVVALFFTACESKEEKLLKCTKYLDSKSCDDVDMIPIIKCFSKIQDEKSCSVVANRCFDKKEAEICRKAGEYQIGYGIGLEAIDEKNRKSSNKELYGKFGYFKNKVTLSEAAKAYKYFGIKYLERGCKMGDKYSCDLIKKYDF